MNCLLCHGPGPTAHVELRYNIGMMIMRQEHATEGELCRRCLHRTFADHTLRNLTLGWWGLISFFMTWYFVFANVGEYVRALGELGTRNAFVGFAPAPATVGGAEAEERLASFSHNVRLRLLSGASVETISQELADTHGVHVQDAIAFVDKLRTPPT